MNLPQNQLDLKKTDSKESKDIKTNPKTDTPKSAKSKVSVSPKESKKMSLYQMNEIITKISAFHLENYMNIILI